MAAPATSSPSPLMHSAPVYCAKEATDMVIPVTEYTSKSHRVIYLPNSTHL